MTNLQHPSTQSTKRITSYDEKGRKEGTRAADAYRNMGRLTPILTHHSPTQYADMGIDRIGLNYYEKYNKRKMRKIVQAAYDV